MPRGGTSAPRNLRPLDFDKVPRGAMAREVRIKHKLRQDEAARLWRVSSRTWQLWEGGSPIHPSAYLLMVLVMKIDGLIMELYEVADELEQGEGAKS